MPMNTEIESLNTTVAKLKREIAELKRSNDALTSEKNLG